MLFTKKIFMVAALVAALAGSATAQYNPFTDDASRRANANRTQVSNPQYDARYNARGNYNNNVTYDRWGNPITTRGNSNNGNYDNNVTYDRWGNPIYNRGNSNNRTDNNNVRYNNGRAVQLGPVRLNY
jgi:hypothetical protein